MMRGQPPAAIHGHRGVGGLVQCRHPGDRPAAGAGGVVRLRAPVRHRQPDRDRAPRRKCRDPAAYVELVRRYLRQRSDRPGRGDDDPAAGLDVSTIANDGVRVPPRIVESVTRADGSTEAETTPAGSRVVSARAPHSADHARVDDPPRRHGVKAAIPATESQARPARRSSPTGSRRCVQRFDVLGHVRGRIRAQQTIRSSWSPS